MAWEEDTALEGTRFNEGARHAQRGATRGPLKGMPMWTGQALIQVGDPVAYKHPMAYKYTLVTAQNQTARVLGYSSLITHQDFI